MTSNESQLKNCIHCTRCRCTHRHCLCHLHLPHCLSFNRRRQQHTQCVPTHTEREGERDYKAALTRERQLLLALLHAPWLHRRGARCLCTHLHEVQRPSRRLHNCGPHDVRRHLVDVVRSGLVLTFNVTSASCCLFLRPVHTSDEILWRMASGERGPERSASEVDFSRFTGLTSGTHSC